MPAPSNNQNAVKGEAQKASSFLYIRCHPKAKAAWVRKAGRKGLSAWTVETLNREAGLRTEKLTQRSRNNPHPSGEQQRHQH